MDFEQMILTQKNLHPKMEPEDVIKLVWQSEFGSGHLISDFEAMYTNLHEEYIKAQPTQELLYEEISEDLSRLNIAAAKQLGLSVSTIFRMFALAGKHGSGAGAMQKMETALRLAAQNAFSFTQEQLKEKMVEFTLSNGQPRHSAEYNLQYAPSYRLVPTRLCKYINLFTKIDALLTQSAAPIIGIDGPCASGKTTLADVISQIYICNVVHADSFFLPAEKRTPERLAQPGGNIDYERLHEEILAHLPIQNELEYKIFSCKTMGFKKIEKIVPNLPIIIEGSYSLHPYFKNVYNLRIFVQESEDIRLCRLEKRETPASFQMFKERWIPYENEYFAKFDIKKNCGLVL